VEGEPAVGHMNSALSSEEKCERSGAGGRRWRV